MSSRTGGLRDKSKSNCLTYYYATTWFSRRGTKLKRTDIERQPQQQYFHQNPMMQKQINKTK